MEEGVGFYEFVLDLSHSYYDIVKLYVAKGGDFKYRIATCCNAGAEGGLCMKKDKVLEVPMKTVLAGLVPDFKEFRP